MGTPQDKQSKHEPSSKFVRWTKLIGMFLVALVVIAISKEIGRSLFQTQRLARPHLVDLPSQPSNSFVDFDRPPTQDTSQAEEMKVNAAHPGWKATVNTPAFQNWLAQQPTSVKKLVQSERADDAILLLDLYKRDQRQAAQ